ncbi:MAG: adenosylmethionine--8-amino-7-oxononanoate transaminase [Pedosphaera sp.]|nr:adenosylmethionine--8-amino-7-oxononanoate transaminase [Pedosphaera sp.]
MKPAGRIARTGKIARQLARLDRAFVWHPFTQMRDWLQKDPIVLVAGKGAVLWDSHGNEYLDANSSIWTNLHGHNHPRINKAIRRQLSQVAHTSMLGFANEPASRLAGRLVTLAAGPRGKSGKRGTRANTLTGPKLTRVFYSDDGSTAVETALKLSYEYSRRTGGHRPRFLGLEGAYHGDTVGAVSLGHIDRFHRAYSGLLFSSDAVMAPYCYRCPYNRAKPERADARDTRRCGWECLDALQRRLDSARKRDRPYTAFVVEPGVQGAAGMIPQPDGWLSQAMERVRSHGAMVIADEVMTAFGRTVGGREFVRETCGGDLPLFGTHQAGVQADFLCLAKGLTGGYLPMAATLTSDAIFGAFLGDYEDFKTFFHGHSYTGNALGAAASEANLDLLTEAASSRRRLELARVFGASLQALWSSSWVGDIRQVGLVAGIELVRDWRTRAPFPLRERAGIRVCDAMARRGVLTRPIGNVVVLMPPYCTSDRQVRRMVEVLNEAIVEVFGRRVL